MTAVLRYGRLRVAGNRLLGGDGSVVQLRGMSLFWSQWQPQFFDARTLGWLRDDWCIDVVRAPLGVHRDGYLAHPRRERRKIEKVIEAAIDLGLYVIVDWHAHDPEVDGAGAFFERLARDYGGCPNLLYEIWNEPDGRYHWGRDIRPYHLRVIERIRRHDARNLIVAGTPHWCHRVDLAARNPLPGPQVVYGLHFYAASNRQPLRDLATDAQARGLALMVTEWGTCRADGGGLVDEAETRRWWAYLERHGISHLNWAVADKAEAAAALHAGAPAAGGWEAGLLTRSGRLVRSLLRSHAQRGGNTAGNAAAV
jgi:endoglucanase